MLKGADTTTQEHCDAFWRWLDSRGINSHRAGIVKAIAEKVNVMMPGIYDENDLVKEETK